MRRSAKAVYDEALRVGGGHAKQVALVERHVADGGDVDQDLLLLMLAAYIATGLGEAFIDVALKKQRDKKFSSDNVPTSTLALALIKRRTMRRPSGSSPRTCGVASASRIRPSSRRKTCWRVRLATRTVSRNRRRPALSLAASR